MEQLQGLCIDRLLKDSIDDGHEVITGLTQVQKCLPPRYFYDQQGSVLFEKICQLPEYYPTRTEASILQQYAREIAMITGNCNLIELGSGSSTKTRWLLNAYEKLYTSLLYIPIDVSGSILETSAQGLLKDYPYLHIHGIVGTYQQALSRIKSNTLSTKMICFLGSTLGNFSPQQCDSFFLDIKDTLTSGDFFLLGIDLQKPIHILEAAYNDSAGVTAAFNINMLNHINNLFEGNFKCQNFHHYAFYNSQQRQIEMHLVSQNDHQVAFKSLELDINLKTQETILTEISRKFNLEEMEEYLADFGIETIKVFTDSQQWFALILAQYVSSNKSKGK